MSKFVDANSQTTPIAIELSDGRKSLLANSCMATIAQAHSYQYGEVTSM